MAVQIPIRALSPLLDLPEYATSGSAGMDLPAAVLAPVTIEPGAFALVSCGFAMAIPEGYEAQIRPRSGLATRHGVTVLNAPGTIDSDYRGEVKVLLINHGSEPFVVTRGMRVGQLVIAQIRHVALREVKELDGTKRGTGGFGSTGTSGI